MNPNFINSETFESIVIAVISVFGLMTAVVGPTLYSEYRTKKLLTSFRNSAIKNLNEARHPGLATEIVLQKIWYVAMSLIALNHLGDRNWRLKDIETSKEEIFSLLGLTLADIKNLAQQGVRSAEDIICIIERCRESPSVAS